MHYSEIFFYSVLSLIPFVLGFIYWSGKQREKDLRRLLEAFNNFEGEDM